MPIPVLKVNLDDAAFRRYLHAFHKYQKELEAQPDMWKGVNDSIKGATIAGAAMAAEIAHQAEETRKLLGEEEKLEHASKRSDERKRRSDREQEKRDEEAGKRRRHAIDQVREYARTVTDATLSMGKWALMGGGAGMVGGALSLWGLDRLMSGVGEERRLSSGMGVSMGQRQGMSLNMQRYFDVNSTLETVSNMQNNPGQWGTFRMMGINPQGKDPAALTYEAAIAARRMFTADKGNLALAQAQGLTNIFSADDLRRMMAEKPDEFNKSIAKGRAFHGLSDDVGRKWQDFQITIDTVKLKLENALIAPLTKFEPMLEKVVEGFGRMLTDLVNNPAVQQGIDKFAKWMGSPQFQADMGKLGGLVRDFGRELAWVVQKFSWLLPASSSADDDQPQQVASLGPLGNISRGDPNARYSGTPGTKYHERHKVGHIPFLGNVYEDRETGQSMARRNNNPGNLMANGRFRSFTNMDEGWAAMEKQLMSDYYKHNQTTVASIINDRKHGWSSEWAPGNTHATAMNYISHVAKALGIGPSTKINMADPKVRQKMMMAMYEVESGSKVHWTRRVQTPAKTHVVIKNQTGASVATTTNSSARGG